MATTPIEQINQGLDIIESKFRRSHDQLETKQRELQDEILQLKQRGVMQPGNPAEGFATKGSSLGAQVVKQIEANADLLQKTRSLRFECKAAGDAVTSASGRVIVSGGVGAPTQMPYGIQAALRRDPANGISALEYHRFTGIEGAAGVQAGEGADKPAVRPTHTAVTQAALTVAGWTVVSRQAMNDSAELMQAVDITLAREIEKAMDATMCGGNVNPAWAGLLSLATAHTSLIYGDLWDAASEAAATMMTGGFRPDVIGISPADWLAITTAKNPTSDDYYSGSYLAPLPETLRGMRIALSPSVTAGKCLVLDSGQIDARLVDQYEVTVGYTGDQFTQNLVTLLAETRIIPVYRSVGAARLVTPKA